MRVVFMGSADFAVPSLRAIVKAGHNLLAIVTQPDRPQGRGRKLAHTPVKEAGLELGLPIHQPSDVRDVKFLDWLRQLIPEVVVVVAYGKILPAEVLSIPKYGCINVHASLLPRYRGAAPIHWAIMQGEKETGVTTMFMDEGMDTGDIILQQRMDIPEEATTGDVYPILAQMGAELLFETLELIQQGKIVRKPQDMALASYAPMLKREHEKIDWQRSAEIIRNQIRGLNPWPGAYAVWEGKPLKIWEAKLWWPSEDIGCLTNLGNHQTGEIIGIVNDEGLLVQTGEGLLLLTQVQPAGKKRMDAIAFSRGYHIAPGTILE